MNTRLRALGLAVATVGLCSPIIATSASSASVPNSGMSSGASDAARANWHCRSYNGSMLKERCVRWTDRDTYFFVGDTDSAINRTRQRMTLTCTVDQSKTFSYGASVSAEAEAGVIFAKAKTSVSANFQRSTTTGTSSSVTISVPARSKRLCQRGTAVYNLQGVLRTKIKEPGQSLQTYYERFRAHIPTHAAWRVGSPRSLS